MLAKYEKIHFISDSKIWYCKYYDLKNMVHWHKEIELIYINEGSLKVGVNNNTFYADAGGLIICKSGDIHFLDSESKKTCVDILILNEDITKNILYDFSPALPYLSKEELKKSNIRVKKLFNAISAELTTKKSFYADVVNAYIVEFFAGCYRHFEGNNAVINPKKHNKNILEAYRRLTEYIDIHYAQMSFNRAAEFMHFSPAHFSKIFSSISGMTFTQYLNLVKIEKAIDMINNSDISITQTALNCGFDSVRHFNRVFKQLTGIAPSQITKDYLINSCIHPKYSIAEGFNPSIHHRKLIRMV